jgi:hypothetical protein
MLKGLTKGQSRCVDSISIDMVRAPMPISNTMDSRHLHMAGGFMIKFFISAWAFLLMAQLGSVM